MATLTDGDVWEVVANSLDYNYLAELFNRTDGDRPSTERLIGLHVMVKLMEYADKYNAAEARELMEEHDRLTLEKRMRGRINPFAGAPQ